MKYCHQTLGNGKKEKRKDIPIPIRIGDQTHTVRMEATITTERKAGTLLLGGLARVRFYDDYGSRFGGLYRVTEERPSDHEGDYRIYVLEKIYQ